MPRRAQSDFAFQGLTVGIEIGLEVGVRIGIRMSMITEFGAEDDSG